MKRISKIIVFVVIATIFPNAMRAQQKKIPRIDKMNDQPSIINIRDWKKVTQDYDNLVFNTELTGEYLPFCTIIPEDKSINYPNRSSIGLSSYVGQNSATISESINIIPAIVGATLVGIDKENQKGINWISMIKEFFNKKNEQNVYLNTSQGGTGGDWWYEIMPNIFFYQLYTLYPDADEEFESQFISVANRQLEVVQLLGGKTNPWQAPNMAYRAFNLLTGKPLAEGVKESESAGSIAWILYQAWLKTGEIKYRYGAEQALDFLNNYTSHPSYELQLPYGIQTAARFNAEVGTDFNISKMMDWAFDATGNARGWGCTVGKWGNYEVSGLIGEARDDGNDYAFVMNGFQQAAALMPVAKYDKGYSYALAKWLLHLANSSRLFYTSYMKDENLEPESRKWSKLLDPNHCIPYEAMKQNWNGISPYAYGDAIAGKWAPTNLSFYSGSSVGYLAALIERTNVEEILQIDLNATDFNGENTYPRYLYYNPTNKTTEVIIDNISGNVDIYDVISETWIASGVSETTTISIAAKDVRQIVLVPAGSSTEVKGNILKIKDGGIIDYHHTNSYRLFPRIQAFSADKSKINFKEHVKFTCLASNISGSEVYSWYLNGKQIENTDSQLEWTAPEQEGDYTVECVLNDGNQTVRSHKVIIKVINPKLLLPMVYYPFNGDTNNAAYNANHAIKEGTTFVNDAQKQSNSAIHIGSQEQYIYTTADASLNTPVMTVSFWLKPEEAPEREQYIISHGSWEERFKMSISPESHALRFTVKTSEGIADVEDPNPLTTGEYVHYTGVFTGSEVQLYRNGELTKSTQLGGTMGYTGRNLIFGREYQTDNKLYFLGDIDEVRLYSEPLDTSVIKQLPTLWEPTLPTSIPEYGYHVEGRIKAWPNPAKSGDNINIQISENEFKEAKIELYDSLGRRIKTLCTSESYMTLSLPNSSGMYILCVQTENWNAKTKIMVN